MSLLPVIPRSSDFLTLAENSSDIVVRSDGDFRCLYANPAVSRFLGGHPEDFVGKTLDETSVLRDRSASWRQAAAEVFERGLPVEIELSLDTVHGHRQYQARLLPELGPHQKTASVLTVMRDVTDTRTGELLEAAVQHFPAGVALVEAPSGRPLLKNADADRIFGVEPGAFRVTGVTDYAAYRGFRADGSEYGASDWPLARSIQSGEAISGELAEIVRRDGSRGFISITSAPVRDRSGRIIAGLVTYNDVTQTKRLEQELVRVHRETALLYRLSDAANRASRLEDVFDTALATILDILDVDRASILLFDADGVMRFKAWRGLSDEYRAAVEGHSPWSRDEKNPAAIYVTDAFTDPSMSSYLPVLRKEGIRALGFVPLVYGQQLVGKFMVYRNDARAFSPHQGEVAQTVAAQIASAVGRGLAEQSLKDGNRQKDEFLAMLSHELRNPLAATRSALALLTASSATPEQASRFTEVIQRQTVNLVRIVDDLLDVSRVTRGLVELKRERLDLNALVPRAVDAVHAAIEAKRHEVSITLPHKPVYVDADPVRLEQVVVNLLSNAVKYTDDGGRIWIALEVEDGKACFRVRDSGKGFDPSFRERIFDLFQQGPKDLDRAQGGLGIGLTIVKRLVELHGGEIRAESPGVGKGSAFTVTLPLVEPKTRRAPVERHLHAVSRDAATVLVIDDHADSGEMLATLIEQWGHVVRLASDGLSGIREAESLRPDVILLDIGLPGQDGYEVARRMRAIPSLADTVLVAITGYGQDSDRKRALAAGFSEHLVKPVSPDLLRSVFSKYLKASGVDGAAEPTRASSGSESA